MMIKINTIEQFENLIEEQTNVYLLKHSETCPVSLSAYDQFENFMYERDINGYYLIVQQARALSDYIAEQTNVKHESPQAFYFTNKTVKWHDSHRNITIANLSKAEE
ncbi:bacillithiol system redox-active protein YtxJ [Macrococcus armenti]|uniref:Bacillithiol system redox-active protein YtxJ n=1 Tax=Macrococcus armenti TaxID=2875764 RepID=A0ABY3ZVU8_9STAP|nr:bacillithiol system redox-active protein YtxJ [Macrococcus armenti]UBH09153.1 bacillithiol system redox-active protein YtxJ [Macrococcus armenti]UBH11448.1 bacillithiol system redox-active protein YtxJ [Macrococcus armenti]UBH13669.1 bacillithiol system redox-active protein YtxJ [Macrococcus armenti]UBH15929.1 bacillithiol system redox-active protein YtxJ [Macrococcus armenti]UBH18290.1 bacillithiol system redox-active protein YtxJ [Macrococcus armenti]